MKTIEVNKEDLYKFLGIEPSETMQISTLTIHIPNDQDKHKFIFNYELMEKVKFNE